MKFWFVCFFFGLVSFRLTNIFYPIKASFLLLSCSDKFFAFFGDVRIDWENLTRGETGDFQSHLFYREHPSREATGGERFALWLAQGLQGGTSQDADREIRPSRRGQ